MKKMLLIACLMLYAATATLAVSDLEGSIVNWDTYYTLYKMTGYPKLVAPQERYDFFDINDNYCGSLCYNYVSEQWEYLGL